MQTKFDITSISKTAHFFIFVPDVAGYVAEIYETLVTTPRQELKLLKEELKQSVPEPLHSMLEKETKEEAIEKHKTREQKETVICGPTCTGELRAGFPASRGLSRRDKLKLLSFQFVSSRETSASRERAGWCYSKNSNINIVQ